VGAPPQAAKTAPTPYLGEPPQAARSPEELQYIKIRKHLSYAPGNAKFGGAINE